MQTGRKRLGLRSLYWALIGGWIRRIGGLNNPIQSTSLILDCTEHPHPHIKMLSTILLNLFLEQSNLLCTEHHHTHNKSLSTILPNQFLCLNHHSFRTLHLVQHLILRLASHIIWTCYLLPLLSRCLCPGKMMYPFPSSTMEVHLQDLHLVGSWLIWVQWAWQLKMCSKIMF